MVVFASVVTRDIVVFVGSAFFALNWNVAGPSRQGSDFVVFFQEDEHLRHSITGRSCYWNVYFSAKGILFIRQAAPSCPSWLRFGLGLGESVVFI